MLSSLPASVDRVTWQAELDKLRVREKAHTLKGDAFAAAHRRLPMVEVDLSTLVVGSHGEVPLIDTFEGRLQMFASYCGIPAALPPTSARAARSIPARCWNCPTFTSATSPTRCSARVRST